MQTRMPPNGSAAFPDARPTGGRRAESGTAAAARSYVRPILIDFRFVSPTFGTCRVRTPFP